MRQSLKVFLIFKGSFMYIFPLRWAKLFKRYNTHILRKGGIIVFDKKVVFILSAAVIITTGLASGYYFYNREINSKDFDSTSIKPDDNKSVIQNSIVENIQSLAQKNEMADFKNAQAEKTNENTKMIYQYHYKNDGKTVTKVENLPPALVNKTRATIENVFDEWSVVTFNNNQIVLRKDIDDDESYLLKEHNGFVAVFYNRGDEQELKEMTKTPINSLPEEEQKLIKNGIVINGNQELIKVLQDYES